MELDELNEGINKIEKKRGEFVKKKHIEKIDEKMSAWSTKQSEKLEEIKEKLKMFENTLINITKALEAAPEKVEVEAKKKVKKKGVKKPQKKGKGFFDKAVDFFVEEIEEEPMKKKPKKKKAKSRKR